MAKFVVLACLAAVLALGEAGPVQVNLAKNKFTWTLCTNHHGAPERVTDGNTDQNYDWGHSCMHTCHRAMPWVAIDLGKRVKVEGIKVWNRIHWSYQLHDLVASVSNRIPPIKAESREICFKHNPVVPSWGVLAYKCCKPRYGRFVQLMKMKHGALTFCELEVFNVAPDFQSPSGCRTDERGSLGPVQENIARGKHSWQTCDNWGGVASRGNDGRVNQIYNEGHSCVGICNTDKPFWAVDLGRNYKVTGIRIWNREHWSYQLSDIQVSVSKRSPPIFADRDEICFVYKATAPSLAILQYRCFKPRTGRYVQVRRMSHGELSFCEVEVFNVAVKEADGWKLGSVN